MPSLSPLCVPGLVLMLSGCASFATRGSARTLDEGTSEVLVGASALTSNPLSSPSLDEGDGYNYSGDDGYPLMEVGVGYGVSEQVELGGRLRMAGDFDLSGNFFQVFPPVLALDTKVQLVRSSDSAHGLDIAADPTVTVSYTAGTGNTDFLSYVQLPVLFGLNLSERNQLVLSPQLMLAMPHLGISARQLIPSVGFAFLHRFESGWGLRPELTAIVPPDSEGRPFHKVGVQATVSVLKR